MEYIGSRISLISKRDIRYVGTLHEISSENSTVALEQVVSFGTEGRRPKEEVPPSDNVYEYIVFRGSDVKDLRIEKEPEKKPAQQPQIPDDPAILGNARPMGTPSIASQSYPQEPQQRPTSQGPPQNQDGQQPPFNQQGRGQGPPRFPDQPLFPYGYPPPNQRFGPNGPQGFPPHGYSGMPYGPPPPGWYPQPGQGFPYPPPQQFYPPHMPPGPPTQHPNQQAPIAKPPTAPEQPVKQEQAVDQQPVEKPAATVRLPSSSATPAPVTAQNGPSPPTESKPDVAAALAPPALTAGKDETAIKAAVSAQKSSRIMPAVPMLSPAMKPRPPVQSAAPATPASSAVTASVAAKSAAARPTQVPTKSFEDANRDARAAVAAAMAKLPPGLGQTQQKQTNGESAMDNLTNKVNEMRTNDTRTSRQPGTGGYAAGHRGGRGGRGGRPRTGSQTKKMEVPKTDYDFATANAKFNKQDLVKEAIATGSPIGSPTDGGNAMSDEAITNGDSEQGAGTASSAGYNKTSSFFDNISSEIKDRDEGSKKLGGREFRSEEQKKNLETFGQGSVDNGYRGGFRGRYRGRGYRGGRGGFPPRGGRGGMRGRDGAVTTEG